MVKKGFIYLWENTHPEVTMHRKYIGQHIGTVEDGYIGSGVIFLKRFYCKKYRGFWKRTILQHCNTIDELNIAEKTWIDKTNAINDAEYCNVREGGDNGLLNKRTIQKIKNTIKKSGRIPWNKGKKCSQQSEKTKNKRRESFKSRFNPIREKRKQYVLSLIKHNGSVKIAELRYKPGFSLRKAANIVKEMRNQNIIKLKYFGHNDVRYIAITNDNI